MSHANADADAGQGPSYTNIKIGDALKLIPQAFDGTKSTLNEFINNVDIAFELVRESDHPILLKFVKTRIQGPARSKLLVRELSSTWAEVRSILLENYASKRTLDFYACKMFSSRQSKGETIAEWASKVDSLQHQFREAVHSAMTEAELAGSLALVGKLSRAVFIQGIYEERIQTIVRARGESITLTEAVEVALTEESAIMSTKEKGHSDRTHQSISVKANMKCFSCGRVGHTSKECRSNIKCKTCGKSGHLTRDCRLEKRIRKVESAYVCKESETAKAVRCESCNLVGHRGPCKKAKPVVCYACHRPGHMARECSENSGVATKNKKPGNDRRA